MATLRHLGHSGLELDLDGLTLAVDPPHPTSLPAVITWTEQERVLGVRGGTGPVAALAAPVNSRTPRSNNRALRPVLR